MNIKRHCHYFILLAAALLFATACACVVSFGDDWGYMLLGQNGVDGYFDAVFNVLPKSNNRIAVHALDILMLQNDLVLWKILNFAAAAAAAYFIAATAARTYATGHGTRKFRLSLTASALSLLILPPAVLSGSVLWATGSVNYFLPAVLLLGGIYYASGFLHSGRHFAPAFVLLALASVTSEQAAFASVAVAVYCCAAAFAKKKRLCLKTTLCAAVCAVGAVFVFFGTGNAARMGYYTEFFDLSFFGKIASNINEWGYVVFSDRGMLTVCLCTMCLFSLCLIKSATVCGTSAKTKVICFSGAALLGVCALSAAAISISGAFGSSLGWVFIVPEAAAFLLISVFCFLPCINDRGGASLVILSAFLQCAMLISPQFGARTVLISALLLSVFCVRCLSALDTATAFACLTLVIALFLPVKRIKSVLVLAAVAVASLLFYFIINKALKKRGGRVSFRTICALACASVCLFAGALMVRGYLRNAAVYAENSRRISSFDPSSGNILTLRLPDNNIYRYHYPCDADAYHTSTFKQVYGISDGTVIEWE